MHVILYGDIWQLLSHRKGLRYVPIWSLTCKRGQSQSPQSMCHHSDSSLLYKCLQTHCNMRTWALDSTGSHTHVFHTMDHCKFLDINIYQVQYSHHHFGRVENRLLHKESNKYWYWLSMHSYLKLSYVDCTVVRCILENTDNFHQLSCMFH